MTVSTSNTPKKKALYTQQRFLFLALDPVHVGTGGYRLGRVDMTIAREPERIYRIFLVPVWPEAPRSYASMRYGKSDVAGQQKGSKIIKVRKTHVPLFTPLAQQLILEVRIQ